jgi:lambda family phage portal protein
MFDSIRRLFKGKARTVKGPGIMVRTYLPAYQQNEANFDFFTNGQTEDANLAQALPKLWQQSRALYHTNSIATKYDQTLRVNVIGSDGYTFQSKVMKKRGDRPNEKVNKAIETQFCAWQWAENCTVTGKMPWQQVREQRLSMTARDGACLTRILRGPQYGPFGFQVQLLPIDALAFYMNEPMREGVEIRMGVERNMFGRTLAYHLNKREAGDWRSYSTGYSKGNTIRVPTSDLILSCKQTDAEATLAAPWCTPVMQLLYQIDAFIEAEVVASRAAACKGGYFSNTMSADDPSGVMDERKWDGNGVQVVGPNETRALPYGWQFTPYDPKHPTANFSEARKALTQAAAVGLRVPYYTLSADLADANYSSMRVGEIDVRENWELIQTWDIHCNELPIYRAWLAQALLMGRIEGMTGADFEECNQPIFKGRGFSWVDPLKEIEAAKMEIQLGLNTRTNLLAKRGMDFEEVVKQLQLEEEILTEADLEELTIEGINNAGKPAPPEAGDGKPEGGDKPTAKPAAKSRFSTNGSH